MATPRTGFRLLDWVERIGNRLPDPVTLFAAGALSILVGSHVAAMVGWQASYVTRDGMREVAAKSLLVGDGLRWVWTNAVENFTSFHPLGVVLVTMLGIGVAERSGLIGALLKRVVVITPTSLLAPSFVLVGIMSNMAADAGYVVLPPLAALIYAKVGRPPLAGMAAVFAGVAAGFSANLLPTSLDPLLQGLTQEAATILDRNYIVDVLCNYWFMIVSTIVLTAVGWFVTVRFVEPRFSKADIEEQVASMHRELGDEVDADAHVPTKAETRGLWWAAIVVAIGFAGLLALVLVPGGALGGSYLKGGREVPTWPDVIVPAMFVLFLLPGIAYGIASGSIRSDRDVAQMMGKTMSTMGMYVVLAFFAGQFVAWFKESNLGTLIALAGVDLLKQFHLPPLLLIAGIILLVAVLNLFVGSASAKWALVSPVLVPLFMGLGIAPELTQAAYRVGDSATNAIAPLNPYLVVILVYMRQYLPKAGLGSLIALMLPYSIAFLIVWIVLLVGYVGLGVPLGPGDVPSFIEPIR
ncbi:MAG: AbgT family transporter [Phycisphaerales bacterium]|nr:AbgT family transporter [Phycisphaerales bacterium]